MKLKTAYVYFGPVRVGRGSDGSEDPLHAQHAVEISDTAIP